MNPDRFPQRPWKAVDKPLFWVVFSVVQVFSHRLDPLNFVSDLEAKEFSIPWCLRGAFMMSLIEGHVMAGLCNRVLGCFLLAKLWLDHVYAWGNCFRPWGYERICSSDIFRSSWIFLKLSVIEDLWQLVPVFCRHHLLNDADING